MKNNNHQLINLIKLIKIKTLLKIIKILCLLKFKVLIIKILLNNNLEKFFKICIRIIIQKFQLNLIGKLILLLKF